MKVRYIIKPEEGLVVCVLTETRFGFTKFLETSGLSKRNAVSNFRINKKAFELSSQYVGVARLQEGDTWDEEMGKKLAYHKAMFKYDTAFRRKAFRFFEDLEDLAQYFEDKISAADNKAFDRHVIRVKELKKVLGE